MKTKLLPPILSCLVLASFLYRGNAQTADDFNEGLTATSPSLGVFKVSWWGSKLSIYQLDFTLDLNSQEWTRLPELFMGTDAPIELNFTITGEDSDQIFYRLIKHPGLIAENSNMLIHDIRFIGDEEMRTVFSGGLDHLPNASEGFFDAGMLFSTGIAAKWNAGKEADPGTSDPDDSFQLPGDVDLGHWMLSGGFGWQFNSDFERDQFDTVDAAGMEIDFEVDPSVDTGRISLSYLFASDEYYMPSRTPNDAMAVFIAELDSSGEPILETQVNLGLLGETQTYSRAINVYNVGDLRRFPTTPPVSNPLSFPVNIEQSGFVNNSPHSDHHEDLPDPLPPYSFGLSGFTSRLEASGGVATAVGDIDVKTRIRQANDFGLGDDNEIAGNRGWGGILFRGSNRLVEEEDFSDLLSGYVAAFGLKSGDPVFVLYKVENLNVNVKTGFIFPNEEVGGFPSDDVDILASELIEDFDASAWYWIRVKAEGDQIQARIWKDGEAEPDTWAIDFTDSIDPIESGFLGLINPDSPPGPEEEATDNRWDVFEILGPEGETIDFSGNELGKLTPLGWSTVGHGRNASEWEVVVDDDEVSGSIGGRHVRHSNNRGWLSVLKYEGPGTVEGGKSYRLKIVVADTDDLKWASTILIEEGSIQVIPE